jgi:zinc protease
VTEPEQTGERRKIIEDNFAPTARIDIVHKIPAGNSPDWYALAVAGHVLSQGVSSRLHQKLVKEKEIAQSASAGADERRGPSLFWVSLSARPGSDLAAMEKLAHDELVRLAREPIEDWELDKVRMQLRRERAQQLYSTRRRANTLGHYAVYYDDPGLINTVWEKFQNVEKADVQRVAAKYFTERNRTVVITLPKSQDAAAQPGH